MRNNTGVWLVVDEINSEAEFGKPSVVNGDWNGQIRQIRNSTGT